MAAALTEMHGQGMIDVLSAGSEPADQVNPMAVAAMAELGVDLTDRSPKLLSNDSVKASDVVITMGCGDACPIYPGKQYLDWELDDPAGQDLDTVRVIRDDINRRVLDLVSTLLSDGTDRQRPRDLRPD